MKVSYYNNYVEIESNCLIYNSYSNMYLLLDKELYNTFKRNINRINKIKEDNIELYQLLLNNGMIVNDEINEIELFNNDRIKRRFSSYHYDLMINPTLDCNLNCWYCYEDHVSGSKMTSKIITNIIKHLEKKYQYDPFKILTVYFFGGEPLLKTKSVVNPLVKEIVSFSKKNNINYNFSITTNGTIITDEFLLLIKDSLIHFQITIDGDKATHNKVRGFKGVNKSNSYDRIINNIKKITNKLENFEITLRINYNAETLPNAHKIINDIKFVTPSKLKFNLVKIWQEESESIDNEDLFFLSEKIKNAGYDVVLTELGRKNNVCYADNYNQALINYDGNVFKCTARDFTNKNAEGYLSDEGDIIWNSEKLTKRLYSGIQTICKDCKLLPSCPGVCTQAVIENGVDNGFCVVKDKGLTFDEFIFANFEKQFNHEN